VKWNLVINGVEQEMEVVSPAPACRFRFDGRERSADVEIPEPGIYSEDPYNDFLPFPGKLTRLRRPMGPGIRLDACVYPGWTVPLDYDPLLAKLVVWSRTRDESIARMIRALGEYDVGGIRTNISFFRQVFEAPEFRAGRFDTGFIDEFLARHKPPSPPPDLAAVAALAAAVDHMGRDARPTQTAASGTSPWLAAGRQEILR
jgi:acetyl-CoA carboxylase, biotin carboxylase subunit